jgi:hypothetical protein
MLAAWANTARQLQNAAWEAPYFTCCKAACKLLCASGLGVSAVPPLSLSVRSIHTLLGAVRKPDIRAVSDEVTSYAFCMYFQAPIC